MKPKIMTKPYGKIYQNKTNVSITPFDIYNLYPVGSIYMSVNSTNPSNYFGGTWEQIKDTFLLACGDTYAAGTTGGEATHKLTTEEMPSHNHTLTPLVDIRQGDGQVNAHSGSLGTHLGGYVSKPNTTVSPTGGDKPHNNMPPYLAVYIWKRVA